MDARMMTLATLLATIACTKGTQGAPDEAVAGKAMAAVSPAAGSDAATTVQVEGAPSAALAAGGATLAQRPVDLLSQAMVVRTGTASVRVDSLAAGMARVRSLATRVGGYVGNTQVTSEGDRAPTATLELRVPSARFDEAVAGIEAMGATENVQVSAEDVGEQYVDLTARVANARKLEQRLLELLAARTGRLSDLLQVEEKLSQVRAEIEQMEGRRRWLSAHASVSTISVTVHEPYPVVSPAGTPAEIAEAFRRAWRNFVGVIAGTIALAGVLVPVAAVVVAGWLIWRRRARMLLHPSA